MEYGPWEMLIHACPSIRSGGSHAWSEHTQTFDFTDYGVWQEESCKWCGIRRGRKLILNFAKKDPITWDMVRG